MIYRTVYIIIKIYIINAHTKRQVQVRVFYIHNIELHPLQMGNDAHASAGVDPGEGRVEGRESELSISNLGIMILQHMVCCGVSGSYGEEVLIHTL